MREITRIDKDVEIILMNNVNGTIILEDGSQKTILYNYGDYEYFTYDQVRRMVSRNRRLFANLHVVVIGSVDKEYTVQQVAGSLGLRREYEGNIDWENIEDFITSLDYRDYEDYVDSLNDNERSRILSITYKLLNEERIETIVCERTFDKYLGEESIIHIIEEELQERRG